MDSYPPNVPNCRAVIKKFDSGVLSQADDVGTILLGDIDVKRAKEVAQFVGPEKIKADRIDAANIDEMVAQMKQGVYEYNTT
ncbi:MAG: hypothetical protein PVI82_11415 [Desulfobacterales bacterium]|jgi:hypothetical protein